jgi:hypothetical protein
MFMSLSFEDAVYLSGRDLKLLSQSDDAPVKGGVNCVMPRICIVLRPNPGVSLGMFSLARLPACEPSDKGTSQCF